MSVRTAARVAAARARAEALETWRLYAAAEAKRRRRRLEQKASRRRNRP